MTCKTLMDKGLLPDNMEYRLLFFSRIRPLITYCGDKINMVISLETIEVVMFSYRFILALDREFSVKSLTIRDNIIIEWPITITEFVKIIENVFSIDIEQRNLGCEASILLTCEKQVKKSIDLKNTLDSIFSSYLRIYTLNTSSVELQFGIVEMKKPYIKYCDNTVTI